MEFKERKETSTTKTWELSEEDVENIIRAYLGVNGDGTVEFDVYGAGFLRGAIVTTTYTVVNL